MWAKAISVIADGECHGGDGVRLHCGPVWTSDTLTQHLHWLTLYVNMHTNELPLHMIHVVFFLFLFFFFFFNGTRIMTVIVQGLHESYAYLPFT